MPLDIGFGAVNAFQMNQYAITCTQTKQAVLIDCGASSQKELDTFLEWITTRNYELKQVWQTHAHLDHVAGLGMLRTMYPNIPIWLHEKERGIYNSFDKRRKEFGFTVEGSGILPDEKSLEWFDKDSRPRNQMTLGNLTFDLFPCSGHSPGHVGFYELNSKAFFCGDFIMQGSIGRTDFPTSSPTEMKASLKRFVELMEDDVVIYPGHGSPTTVQREKQHNPYLQEFL